MGRVYGTRHAGLRRINEGVYAILHRETEEGVVIVVVAHGMRDLDAVFGE